MEQRNYKKVEQNYPLLSTFLSKIQKLLYNKIPIYRDYSLKMLMLILLSITIGSCYSIESDCRNIPIEPTPIPPTPPPLPRDGFWEIMPGSTSIHRIACDVNGNLLALLLGSSIHFYNGTSWQLISTGTALTGINAIAVAPNGDAYVLGTVSFNRSTNGGISWQHAFSPDTIKKNELAEITISPSGDIYFATLNNVYVPNGSSWRKANTYGLSGTLSCPIALSPNGGTLYAVEKVSSVRYYIIRSTDAGNSWLRSINYFSDTIRRLTIVDNNTIFVAAGYNGILKSTDGGQHWNRCDTIIPGRVNCSHDIIYNSRTGTLFADIDGYAFNGCNVVISNDLGKSWRVQNGGLTDDPILHSYSFVFSPTTGDTYLKSSYSNNRFIMWENIIDFGDVYRYVPPIE